MSGCVNTSVLSRNACAAVLVVCLPLTAAVAQHRPAVYSTAELQQRVIDANTRVRAWYFEFESERILPTGKLADSYVHRVVAARTPDRYYLWNAHGTARMDWRDDPDQQRLYLVSDTATAEQPFHRSFRSWRWVSKTTVPGSSQGEFLFSALAWWPLEDRPPPQPGELPTVFTAIVGSGKYRVNPEQDLIQGRWCHVLEYPGRDRLWLDCEHGCALLVREAFDRSSGALRSRIEAREHREVIPGIWAPFEFRNTHFDTDKSKPGRGTLIKTLDSTLKVLEVRLNEQVQDDLFHFEPKPGSLQIFSDKQIKQTVPGGFDYLDGVIDWAQRRRSFSSIPFADTGSAAEAILEYTTVGAGVGVFIAVFFCRCWRARNIQRNVAPKRLDAAKEIGT